MPPNGDDTDALLNDLESELSSADTDALLNELETHTVPQKTEAPSRPTKLPESSLPWFHPEKGVMAGLTRGFMGNLGTSLAGKLLPQRESIDGIPAEYAGGDIGETLESNFQQEKKAHPYQVGTGQVISSIPAAYLGGAGGAKLAATAGEAALGAGLGGMAPAALEAFNESQGGPTERLHTTEQHFDENPGSTALGVALPALGEAAAPVLKRVAKPLIDAGNRGLAKIGLSGSSLGRILVDKGKQGLADTGAAMREAGLNKSRKLSDLFSPPDAEQMALNAHEVTQKLGGPKGAISTLEDTMARTTHPDLRASDGSLLPFGETSIPREELTAPLRSRASDLRGRASSDADRTIKALERQAQLFERSAKPRETFVDPVAEVPPPLPAKPKLLPSGASTELAPHPGPWRAPEINQAQVTGLGEAPPLVTPPGAPDIQPPLLPEYGTQPPMAQLPAGNNMPAPLLPPGPPSPMQLPPNTNALRPLPPGKGVITPPAPFRKPGAEPLNVQSPIIPPAPEQTALAPIEGDFTSKIVPGAEAPPIIPASTSIQKFDPGNVPSIWQRIKMRMPGAPAELPPGNGPLVTPAPEPLGLPSGNGVMTPPAPDLGPVPGVLGRGGKYPPEPVIDADFEPMGMPVETPAAPPVFPRQRIKLGAEPEPPAQFEMNPETEVPYTFNDALADKRAIGNQLFARDQPLFQRRVGEKQASEIAWQTLKDQTNKRIDEGLASGVLNPQNVADYKAAMRQFGPAADVAIDAGREAGRAMKRPDSVLRGSAAFAEDALPQVGYKLGRGLEMAGQASKELAKYGGALSVGESGEQHRGITSADMQQHNLEKENQEKQQLNEDMKKSMFSEWLGKLGI